MQSQVRPHLDLTFENILSHINTVYVLRTRPGAYDRGRAATEEPEFNALRLKVWNREPIRIMQIINKFLGPNDVHSRIRNGDFPVLPERHEPGRLDKVLCAFLLLTFVFLNVLSSCRRGLYISDIPLHDATRDLVLLSEQFEAEYKLTRNLEILTDKLQSTYRELDGEKQKTDG